MTKRQQRTPQEIIAETEARLERLRLREAKNQARSNPTVAPLLAEMDDLNRQVREAAKLLGDGPQSATVRIEKHLVWINKIKDEAEHAQSVLDIASAAKADLQTQIDSATQNILNTPKETSIEG